MSRMARLRDEWEKKERGEDPHKPKDKRGALSKLWDTVNIADSGRSWTTENPDEDASKRSSGDQFKDTVKNIFSSYDTISKGVGEGLAYDTDEARGARKSQEDLLDSNTRLINELGKELKNTKDEKKRARIKKTIDALAKDSGETAKELSDRNTEIAERTDPVKNAAAIGSIGFDIATAGIGAGAFQAGKRGSYMARAATEGGLAGSVGGGLGAVEGRGSETSMSDIVHGSLSGAVLGTALGAGGAALGSMKLKPLGEEGSIANPFYRHATTADKVDSILNDGKLKAGRQLDGPGGTSGKPVPVDPNDFDTNPGVFMDTESSKPWLRQGKENVELQFNEDVIKKQGDIKTSGTQAVVSNDVPVTPKTVAEVRVGSEEVAEKFRNKGFKKVTVDESLNLTNQPAASNLDGYTHYTSPENAAMNADVDTPTASLEVPVARTPKDIENLGMREIDEAIPSQPAPKSQTKAQQEAAFIGADLNRLAKETGVGVDAVDESVAKKASDALQGVVDQPTSKSSFVRSIANDFQDSITVAAKTVGDVGARYVKDLVAGEKFKRDVLNGLRNDLVEIQAIGKKLTGKSGRNKTTRVARIDLGKRIGAALDDRANADNFLRNADERKLFDHYVKVFDSIKELRQARGLEVIDNYRPWVSMKEASEAPTWLSKSLTDSRVETLSRFSKERVRDEVGDDVDDNLIDMIYGYVNSQLNEMAYDAPVRNFKKALNEMPPTSRANSPQFKEGMEYLAELTQQAVNPKANTKAGNLVSKMGNRVYSSVLPFNLRLTLQNKTQKWAANSRVSKNAVKLSKTMNAPEFKDLEKGLIFGESTVFGQLEDLNIKPSARGLKDKIKNVDFYSRSEEANVVTSFRKGAAQAIIESEPYKAAVKSGMKKKDAMIAALKDENVAKLATERGNMVVNDTQFGASHLARPAALRSEGRVFGIPKKSIMMFTRFPIGMSQHVLETLDGKSARALDVLKNGDPRAVPIAEMRASYGVLLDALKDTKKAVKNGVDVDIPEDVLTSQIDTITKNLKIIDKTLKTKSQVRSGKTLKNLAKMWTAAAAIQVIFDGGIQSFANDPIGQSAEAMDKTNPTATSMIYGRGSKLTGITSAALPFNQYGLNERALTNYIPGVGLAVNRGRDVAKLAKSLMGEPED